MSIPNIQSLLLPLLQHLADGEEHVSQETVGTLATLFQLSEAERAQLLPSGNQTIFTKRVAWAKSHLTQAGLIDAPRRGVSRITDRGREMLQQHPQELTLQGLNQFPAYRAFRSGAKGTMPPATPLPGNDLAPQEYLELGFQQLRTELAAELLSQIKACPPDFFERLVIELLVAMGYGGSRKEAGQAVGKSGDGGIDGMIKEDRLGLDVIYIQAKRWEGAVGRPDVQKFAGALQGQRARKGIFLTTSAFTKDALAFATAIDTKIILM